MEKYSRNLIILGVFYAAASWGQTENHGRKELVRGPTKQTIAMDMDAYKQKVAQPLDILRASHGYHGGYNEYVWERMYARQGKAHAMNYSHPAFYDPKLYGLRSYYKPVNRPNYIYYGSLKNGVCGARHDGQES